MTNVAYEWLRSIADDEDNAEWVWVRDVESRGGTVSGSPGGRVEALDEICRFQPPAKVGPDLAAARAYAFHGDGEVIIG